MGQDSSTRGRPTRYTRAFAVLLVVSAIAMLAPAAQAAVPARSFTARGVNVQTTNNGRWLMDIEAIKPSGDVYVYLHVTLRKHSDPDGTGPMSQEERHKWSFFLAREALSIGDGLSTGYLRTGTSMGDFGSLRFTFEPEPAWDLEPGCNDANRSRRVNVRGTVDFWTHEQVWGTIIEEPTWGRLATSDGTCERTPCPPTGYGAVMNGGYSHVEVTQPAGGDHAVITYDYYESNGADIYRTLEVTVPRAQVTLDDDPLLGSIESGRPLRVRGALTFHDANEPYTTEPAPCGTDKKTWRRAYAGSWDGELRAVFVTGAAPVLHFDGSLYRILVRRIE